MKRKITSDDQLQPPAPAAVTAAPAADTFFDLSFRGALPELLRQLAARLESNEVTAEQFSWQISRERLDFTAQIDMRPRL